MRKGKVSLHLVGKKSLILGTLLTSLLSIFIYLGNIGGCGGGDHGQADGGEVANPLFNGTFGGVITTTQGGETRSVFQVFELFVDSPLMGEVKSPPGSSSVCSEQHFLITGDAVGNLATISGSFDAECPGTLSSTLELTDDNTILVTAEGSDCNGPFTSTGSLVRADSDCPAVNFLSFVSRGQGLLCGGCFPTPEGELCADYFDFPCDTPSYCEATDCHTLDCPGVSNNINVDDDGRISWVESFDDVTVIWTCH